MSQVANQTIQTVDLKNEDYVFKGVYLSDVSQFDRSNQNKTNLIFVKFVGSKSMSVSPSMLYFGDVDFEKLNDLRGQKVDVQLGGSDKGFNVKHIQPSV
jgi:hypothetical protein